MSEIVCCDVISIDSKGITLKHQKNNIYIYFDECARNYATEKALITNKCIAERDITTLSFIFYTLPKTKLVFKKHLLGKFIPNKSALNKFFYLQKAIEEFGYVSYDLS